MSLAISHSLNLLMHWKSVVLHWIEKSNHALQAIRAGMNFSYGKANGMKLRIYYRK